MGNDLTKEQMRQLDEETRKNASNIGVGFGDIVRAPKRLVGGIKKIESIPIIGEGFKALEAEFPELVVAREAAEAAVDIEEHVKKLTGDDIEKQADKVDRFFGYTGNLTEEEKQSGEMFKRGKKHMIQEW